MGEVEARQLRAFVAVADRLHFGQAAEALGVAQPAVSQLLRRLETTLGLSLFDRSSHSVALTAGGSALLPHARVAIDAADRLIRTATELAEGRTGVLRLATTPGTGPRLGALIGTYTSAHPDVALDLRVLDTNQKLGALKEGRIDLALLRSEPPDDPALHRRVAWQERYVMLIPEGHEAASRNPADAQALADLPMLIVERAAQPTMHDQLLEVCAAMGLAPRLGPATRSPQDMVAMIAAGLGWMLYIEGNLPDSSPGVAIRRLPPPDPPSDVWIVWRAVGASPQALALVNLLDALTAPSR